MNFLTRHAPYHDCGRSARRGWAFVRTMVPTTVVVTVLIVDSQIHVWKASSQERPWPAGGGPSHRSDQFLPEDALAEMDAAGVDKSVLVPPSFEGDYNDLAVTAASTYPERFLVVGRIGLDDPSNATRLPAWKDQPGMKGIRVTFLRGRFAGWLHDGTADWFWPEAERWQIPIMMYAPEQSERIADLARLFPALRIILDHANLHTRLRDNELVDAVRAVLPLSSLPNVAVKLSALPCYTTEPYPFPALHAVIAEFVGAFGAERCFWGSDLTRLPCPYREAVDLFLNELPFLSGRELELIMGQALLRWLDGASAEVAQVDDDASAQRSETSAAV